MSNQPPHFPPYGAQPPQQQQPGYPPVAWPAQQQFGQPQFGPPGGYPGSYPPKKKGGAGCLIGLLVGIVLLFVLAGGGLAAWWFTAKSPEDVVDAYYDAVIAHECEEAVGYLTEDFWRRGGATSESEAVGNCERSYSAAAPQRPTSISEGSSSGGSAEVDVVVPAPVVPVDPSLGIDLPDSYDLTYELVKEGRNWKIDDVTSDTAAPSGAPSGSAPTLPGQLPSGDPGGQGPSAGGANPVPPTTSTSPAPAASNPSAESVWGGRDDVKFEITQTTRTLRGRLRRQGMWDRPSCAVGVTAAASSALASCIGRIEASYLGETDGIRLTEQVFSFPDDASATAFARLFTNTYAPKVIQFPTLSDAVNSPWSESRVESVGNHVVATLFAVSSTSAKQKGQDHLHALHAETVSAFYWD